MLGVTLSLPSEYNDHFSKLKRQRAIIHFNFMLYLGNKLAKVDALCGFTSILYNKLIPFIVFYFKEVVLYI